AGKRWNAPAPGEATSATRQTAPARSALLRSSSSPSIRLASAAALRDAPCARTPRARAAAGSCRLRARRAHGRSSRGGTRRRADSGTSPASGSGHAAASTSGRLAEPTASAVRPAPVGLDRLPVADEAGATFDYQVELLLR